MKPTGTVTFLFTDIEGSTRLSQEFPDSYHAAFERHNEILQKAVEYNNGFVFKTAGDAFCCAFQKAEDAVKAAVDIQKSLSSENLTNPVIRVRFGIHTGNSEWNGTDYMGYVTLARSARVMSAANAEQIIISNNTYELCRDKYDALKEKDVTFRDLGERRLKDLTQPMKLYQVLASGIPSEFPPLNTLDARPNNLPEQLTSFIGRFEEINKIKELLNQTRLLTLTGSGGSGKTRLAIQVAGDVIDDYSNGVWFIELASLSEGSLLPPAIAKEFGLKEEPDRSPEQTLREYLKDKEMLIILDNCEHLIAPCAELTESLLSNCPGLKIIATSREYLRCHGEQTHRVSSLECPDPKLKTTPEKLSQYEAVRLFIERALAVNSAFRVNNSNAAALAEICYQLDGIPLAIELAAARTKILNIEKIHERLNDRFRLLTGGKRTALPRQQTLSALIDWSYDLLSEEEKIMWNRLSIFSGGWKMEAAEEICPDEMISKHDVMDIISSLTEKSIIIYNEVKARFSMLESIRQYGEEKNNEKRETEKLPDKHLHYYLKLAESANKKIREPESLQILDSESGNIEKSFKLAVENNYTEFGLRLAFAMGKYWQLRGYLSDGIRRFESVLPEKPEIKDSIYCKVICQLGNFARLKGDVDRARKLIEESLQISRDMGDRSGIKDTLVRLGILEYDQGRFEEAAKSYEESLAINRESGDKLSIAILLNNLGNVYSNQGDYSRAFKLYEESLATRREYGDVLGSAICLNNLGIIAYEQGEYEKAEDLLQESLKFRYQMGDRQGIAITLMNLGNTSYNQGEYKKAYGLYKESLEISLEIDDKGCIADTLYYLGNVLLEQNDPEQSLKYFQDSLVLSREIKAKSQIAIALYGLGRSSFLRNEFEEAGKYYKESADLNIQSGNKKDIALTLLRYSEMLVKCGSYGTVAKLFGFINKKYFEQSKIKFPLADRIIYEDSISKLKSKLDPEEFSKYFKEGERLSIEEAVNIITNYKLQTGNY